MSDLPIPFSDTMILALGQGRKIQTRRLLNVGVPAPPAMDAIHPSNKVKHDRPYLDSYCSEPKTPANPRGMSNRWCWWTRDDRQCLPTFKVKYKPGDRLWVREAWRAPKSLDIYSGKQIGEKALDAGYRSPWSPILYIADGAKNSASDWATFGDGHNWAEPGRYRYARYMPRWASRLTLIVKEVRVQRLQDISEEDAIAEGVARHAVGCNDGVTRQLWFGVPHCGNHTARLAYQDLWESLHNPKGLCADDNVDGWAANPWIVAVSFEIHKSNIDALAREAA